MGRSAVLCLMLVACASARAAGPAPAGTALAGVNHPPRSATAAAGEAGEAGPGAGFGPGGNPGPGGESGSGAGSGLPPGDALPGQENGPLRFTFPTPGPLPVPAWRPPPYDIPWSLRPEDHFWFARPIAADEVNWPLAVYRYGGTYFGQMSAHAGVDINAPVGTPVLAAGPGTVIWAGWGLYGARPVEDDPYGLAVAIRHDFGFGGQPLFTVYAHLSEVEVWLDQPVATGQKIGEVGVTGNTTGQHLHFEVRQGKNNYASTRNPELWLAPPQGWGVLAGRVLDAKGRPLPEQQVTIRSLEGGGRWQVWTYGAKVAQPDDFYRENFVISDLPAGQYSISVADETAGQSKTFTQRVDLLPGRTTLVVFTPSQGFVVEPTATPRPFPTAPGP